MKKLLLSLLCFVSIGVFATEIDTLYVGSNFYGYKVQEIAPTDIVTRSVDYLKLTLYSKYDNCSYTYYLRKYSKLFVSYGSISKQFYIYASATEYQKGIYWSGISDKNREVWIDSYDYNCVIVRKYHLELEPIKTELNH